MKFIQFEACDKRPCLICIDNISFICTARDDNYQEVREMTDVYFVGQSEDYVTVNLPYDDVVRHLESTGLGVFKPFYSGR